MHAVRARPLPAIKNNIEPDEHREEADTIPTRGVNPETRLAPGLRPTLCTSVGLVGGANAPPPRALIYLSSYPKAAPLRGLPWAIGLTPRRAGLTKFRSPAARHPYKLVVVCEPPRALASRIFEPVKRAAANRQARERLLTNEIQIEPRL